MHITLNQKNRGFTLIETIISISIFSAVGLLVVGILGEGIKIYESIVNIKEISDNMSLAQQRFNNDVFGLRDINHIIYADKTTFKFINSDLDVIQYRYDSNAGKFYRSQNFEGEYLLAQYLTEPTGFSYYKVADLPINQDPLNNANLLLIWQIRLDLYGVKGSQIMNTRTNIFPQNLKNGIVG